MRITGGFLKNQVLQTPKGNRTRPTSEKFRQSVFNIAQYHVENSHFLDLFAGSGAMGMEALSRGAKEATFIEKDPQALKALRENLQTLDLFPLSNLYAGDVLTTLKKFKGKTFDLIYVDPPYGKGLAEKTLLTIDSLHLLHVEGLLLVEEGEEIAFPSSYAYLKEKRKRKVGSTFLYEFITKSSTI